MCTSVCLHIVVCIKHVFVLNACTYGVRVQYISMCVAYMLHVCMWYVSDI